MRRLIRKMFRAMTGTVPSFKAHYEKLGRLASEPDKDAPTPAAVGAATRVLKALEADGYMPTHVETSGDGGLIIGLNSEPHAQIECLESGRLDVFLCRGRGQFGNFECGTDAAELTWAVARVKEFIG